MTAAVAGAEALPPASPVAESEDSRLGLWKCQPTWLRWAWALVVVRLVLRIWVSGGAYFRLDDFYVMYEADRRSLLDFALHGYNGHLLPGGFAVGWLLQNLAPASWPAAVVVVTLLDAVGLVFLVLLLNRMFAPSPWLLVPVGIGLFAPVWAGSTVWLISAYILLPMMAATYATLYFLVGYLTTRRRWDLILSLLAFVVGLAFWEKSILITIPVGFFIVFFYPAPRQEWMRARLAPLVAFAAVASAYLVLFTRAVSLNDSLTARPTVLDVLDVARVSAGSVLIPSLWGGPWVAPLDEGGVFSAPPWFAGALALELALLTVVVAFLRRGPRALLPWVMVLVYIAFDAVLASLARFGSLGSLIGLDPRYVADALPVVVIALALSFSSPRGVSSPPVRWEVPSWVRSATALLVVGFVVVNSCLFTTGLIAQTWRESPTQPFVEALRDDAARLGEPSVIDRGLPAAVMPSVFIHPVASYVADALHIPVRWGKPTDRLYAVSDDGHIVAADVAPTAASIPGPDGACGYAVKGASREIPLNRPAYSWPWVMRIQYLSSAATTAAISMGGKPVTVPFAEGAGEVFVQIDGEGDVVTVGAPTGDGGLCIAGIAVGTAVPSVTANAVP